MSHECVIIWCRQYIICARAFIYKHQTRPSVEASHTVAFRLNAFWPRTAFTIAKRNDMVVVIVMLAFKIDLVKKTEKQKEFVSILNKSLVEN